MMANFQQNCEWWFPAEGSTTKGLGDTHTDRRDSLPITVEPKSDAYQILIPAHVLLFSQPTVTLLGALRNYPDTEEAAFIPW